MVLSAGPALVPRTPPDLHHRLQLLMTRFWFRNTVPRFWEAKQIRELDLGWGLGGFCEQRFKLSKGWLKAAPVDVAAPLAASWNRGSLSSPCQVTPFTQGLRINSVFQLVLKPS